MHPTGDYFMQICQFNLLCSDHSSELIILEMPLSKRCFRAIF
ncbi:hypothetical protein AM1_3050 [Acaryochloris marina MBIC11017]|uniref:Uncharacterized protein n=1 Tax=Acaryochloris marina (strain MBIC 11017) TaxID=329726 RepID=B0CDH7_ACAM1|nr:hypothetical protein AM1_3050 [Acaryochloris marina MBIC11017]